jgi:hypothetical protein
MGAIAYSSLYFYAITGHYISDDSSSILVLSLLPDPTFAEKPAQHATYCWIYCAVLIHFLYNAIVYILSSPHSDKSNPLFCDFSLSLNKRYHLLKGFYCYTESKSSKNPSNMFVFAPHPMAVSNCSQYCYS